MKAVVNQCLEFGLRGLIGKVPPEKQSHWFVWLNLVNAELSLKRHGTGKERDPRRWGERGTIPNARVSPPELRWAAIRAILKFCQL